MSADNWAKCPRCERRHEAKIAALKAKSDAAYGTVPLAEWKALEDDLKLASVPFDKTEFREDYEICGADEGEVIVTYSGGCRVCGLSCEFQHVVKIEGLDA